MLISPRAHARTCWIARRGRGSEGCADSKRCRTCSAHAAAHKARSRWSESVSVPPRRMVMKRESRSLGRIMVAPFLLHLPNAGIERLPARYAQPRKHHAMLMKDKLAGSPLE